MIVNPDPQGWEIIYQRAHALLAMQLAAHWEAKTHPTRWLETLAAILQHDDGGDDFQQGRQYLTEAGAPRDFMLPGGRLSVEQAQKVTQSSRYRGRWIALLTSLHLSAIHEPERGQKAEMDRLLDEHRAYQAEMMKALPVKKVDLDQAYRIFRFAEELSLILCHHHLPAGERTLEIWEGYTVMQRSDETLVVDPWCFEENRFTVTVEATCLSQLHFKDDAELYTTLQKGEIHTLTWEFVK